MFQLGASVRGLSGEKSSGHRPAFPFQPIHSSPQQTREVEPMLGQCWASVLDDEPTLTQHWFNVSCLLGQKLMICEHVSVNGSMLAQCWVSVADVFPALNQHMGDASYFTGTLNKLLAAATSLCTWMYQGGSR